MFYEQGVSREDTLILYVCAYMCVSVECGVALQLSCSHQRQLVQCLVATGGLQILAVPASKEMGGAHQDSSPISPCYIAVLLAFGHTLVIPAT